MIAWPAIIHYAGQAELTYLSNQSQWDSERELHAHGYRAQDRLIDSAGKIYALARNASDKLVPAPTSETVSLIELLKLIREHAAQNGLCCVAKFSAGSVAEAILMLGTLAHEA